MKKKFTGFILCFCMLCMGLLAGCSLVERDYDRYYNQVVAVVEHNDTGKRAEITKSELISGYQSYGYTYEQYNGNTREEAFAMTLTALEDRKITLMTAEDEFQVNSDGTGLTTKEKTYIYQQVVDSLNSNLESYYDEIVGTQEDESSADITFEGYSKTAKIRESVNSNGETVYVIERTNIEEELLGSFHPTVNRDFNNSEDKALIYENFKDYVLNSNDDYRKAFTNYYNDLRASEYGQNLSTDAPSVYEREIERLYTVAYENYILEKYSHSNRYLDSISNITPSQIVDLYASKVRQSYTQYQLENDSNYETNVQDSLNDVYYFKSGDGETKFFTVANVLFMFDEEQQAKYDAITAKIEADDGGYYQSQYQKELDRLYSSIMPVVREYNIYTGVYEEQEQSDLTVDQAYSRMSQALLTAQTTSDVNTIGDTINEFIYIYGEDTGMFNAESNYVIGIDAEGNAVSSFVESFNEAAIELYDNGNAQIGDISGLVRSEYGIHVLIYTGECENLFDGINSSFTLNENAIETLYSTRVNILVDKTYFDVLYDEIYTDNFSYYESANLNFLKENYSITEYSSRYKDLI